MRFRRLAAALTCVAFIGCDSGTPAAPSAPSDAPGAKEAPPSSSLKPEKGKKGQIPGGQISGTLD